MPVPKYSVSVAVSIAGVLQADPATPFVQGSNVGDGTLGSPTNLDGAQNSVGPQITPQDTQGCNAPENFWTPNC